MEKEIVFNTVGYCTELTEMELSDATKALIIQVLDMQLPNIPKAFEEFIGRTMAFAIEKGYKPEEMNEKITYRVQYVCRTYIEVARQVDVSTPHWNRYESTQDNINFVDSAYSADRNVLGQKLADSVLADAKHKVDLREAEKAKDMVDNYKKMEARLHEVEIYLTRLIKVSLLNALCAAGLVHPETAHCEEDEPTEEQQEALETAGLDC